MRMKPSSPAAKPISRAKARNAAILNQLATPGLGSLLAGRWIAGTGQLILFLIGFAVFIIWFIEQMTQFYGQIADDVPVKPIWYLFRISVALTGASWLWSLVTSINLLRQAEADVPPPTISEPPILKP